MNAGKLNRRVTLQSSVPEWQGNTWASVETLSVQATIAARQASQPYTHMITIRYRRDVPDDLVIFYEGKTYEIVGPPIDLNQQHRYLKFICVELQVTEPQMRQTVQIIPCTRYGRHAPEYGAPVAVRARIDPKTGSDDAIGYFPPGTAIKIDDRVECEGKTYLVVHVGADRGAAEIAHVEVNLRGIRL